PHSTVLCPLSLHDALPILALYDSYVGKPSPGIHLGVKQDLTAEQRLRRKGCRDQRERSRSGEPFGFLDGSLPKPRALESRMPGKDRKSTRLNSSHGSISYA